MQLFILKTNIKNKRKASSIAPILENMNTVLDWNIDLQDIDKVLRIEAKETVKESEIINLIRTQGFYCETLND